MSKFTKIFLYLVLGFAYFSKSAYAEPVEVNPGTLSQPVLDMLKNLIVDNDAYVRKYGKNHFKLFMDKQTPRSVIVACSDSRFHLHSVDSTPDNDVFVVRNIGNQLRNSLGSVDYAVKHLNTPLLVIIGHSSCGAVKAVMDNPKNLEPAIKKELAYLQVPVKNMAPTKADVAMNVEANIDHQVEFALKHYKKEVESGKLLVVGALYDFQDYEHKGNGRLIILNVNGNKDKEAITKITNAAIKLGVYH